MGPTDRLNAYLKTIRNSSFEWGKHDCFTFTNTAFKEMYGEGWGDDLSGIYMSNKGVPLRRDALKKAFGYKTFEAAVDDRLVPYKGVPPRGSLVTTKHAQRWVIGVAMGISVGTSAVFLSKEGLLSLPIEMIDRAWTRK